MASVSRAYPQDQFIALRRQNAATDEAAPIASGVDIGALNFRYRIEGDDPAWRPLRAFDDGRQVFIEFPSGIGQGEMPPLWVIGAEGGAELVNYRVRGNHMIVHRLFAAAELRLGGEHRQKVRIVRTDGRPQSWPRARTMRAATGGRQSRCACARAARRSQGFRAKCCWAWARWPPSASAARCSSRCDRSIRLAGQNSTTPAPAIVRRRTGWPTSHATTPGCRTTRRSSGRRCRVTSAGPMVNAGTVAPSMPQPAAGPSPEQQRIAQEQEAARTSHLFATTNAGQTVSAVIPAGGALPGAVPNGAGSPGLTSQDHKLAFLNGDVDRRTVSPDRVEAPASTNILQAGAVIAASLLTGLRSDLPGQVTAQVTENVYDSPTGRILLIPQGTRLVGQYDARVAFGQSRALLVWNRLIMPNGRSIVMERQPGADPEGYAGLEDQVDNHWGMLFKAAILSTLLSVGSEAGTSDNENSLVQAIRQGASQSFSQVGEQVVGRSLNVQPTITIRPGFPVRVLVTHDLVLEPYQR